MKRSEKPFFVQNLTQELKLATSLVLVNFSGLSVKNQQILKKRLNEVQAKMVIVKNTLFKLAGKEAGSPQEVLSDTVLSGPTALIIGSQDPMAPLQVLAAFARQFEVPQFKVGIIDSTFCDKDTLTKLASLPSKEVLLAQAIGTIASPMYLLTGVLRANLQKLVYILNQASQSKQ